MAAFLFISVLLPIIKNLGKHKLKTIRLTSNINGVQTGFGDAFRKLGPIPILAKPDPYLQKNQVVLNWYPKIKAMRSGGAISGDFDTKKNQTHLTANHVAFLDLERLYFELERFKAERGWFNLNLTCQGIAELLADQSWYTLVIPAEELVRLIREITALGANRAVPAQEVCGALLHVPQTGVGIAPPRVS